VGEIPRLVSRFFVCGSAALWPLRLFAAACSGPDPSPHFSKKTFPKITRLLPIPLPHKHLSLLNGRKNILQIRL